MEFTKGKQRSIKVPACLSQDEAELVREASEKTYMSMSAYMRKCAISSAKKELSQE